MKREAIIISIIFLFGCIFTTEILHSSDEAIGAIKGNYSEVSHIDKCSADIGCSSDIQVSEISGGWKIVFWEGWGDCPAGCIQKKFHPFTAYKNGTIIKEPAYYSPESIETNFTECSSADSIEEYWGIFCNDESIREYSDWFEIENVSIPLKTNHEILLYWIPCGAAGGDVFGSHAFNVIGTNTFCPMNDENGAKLFSPITDENALRYFVFMKLTNAGTMYGRVYDIIYDEESYNRYLEENPCNVTSTPPYKGTTVERTEDGFVIHWLFYRPTIQAIIGYVDINISTDGVITIGEAEQIADCGPGIMF